jgi:hypothetical protein
LDRHKPELTIETSAESKKVFEISPKTVKGENVRVTASPAGGGQAAIFINAS